MAHEMQPLDRLRAGFAPADHELFARLRMLDNLHAVGVRANNPSDALEQLLIYLGGGESAVKFYHIVDRGNFLETVKSNKLLTPPKPKAH
jgi:hypothetical protein